MGTVSARYFAAKHYCCRRNGIYASGLTLIALSCLVRRLLSAPPQDYVADHKSELRVPSRTRHELGYGNTQLIGLLDTSHTWPLDLCKGVVLLDEGNVASSWELGEPWFAYNVTVPVGSSDASVYIGSAASDRTLSGSPVVGCPDLLSIGEEGNTTSNKYPLGYSSPQ
jgi:hypothetical protein